MNDLIYRWKEKNPVQMVANLSLPGGFKLDGFGNQNCDVKTATGRGRAQEAHPKTGTCPVSRFDILKKC